MKKGNSGIAASADPQHTWEEKRVLFFDRAGIPSDIVGKVVQITHQSGELEVFINAMNINTNSTDYQEICLTPAESFIQVRKVSILRGHEEGFDISSHRVLKFLYANHSSYWRMILDGSQYQEVSLKVLR